jgi:hypothetical protein
MSHRHELIQSWSAQNDVCDTSTGAAQEQPDVILLRGSPLASWLLALGEREGH